MLRAWWEKVAVELCLSCRKHRFRSGAGTVDRLLGDFETALPVELDSKVLADGRYSRILQQGLELGGVHGLAKKMMELDSGLALPGGLFFKTGKGDKYRGFQVFELF